MSKKASDIRRRKIHHKLLFIFSFTFLFSLFLFQSHLWFFLTTGKERVDFDKEIGQYTSDKTGTFLGQTIAVPDYIASVPTAHASAVVLGDTNNKRIEVDLTNQRLYAFENNAKVMDFPISSGKWNHTPTGNFLIWIKLRYTRMTGGNKAIGTYYDLPNVPFTMFLYNAEHPKWEGYGIHGAYWHNNFGHPMSHGCINLSIPDSEKLYYWALPDLQGKSSILASDNNPGTPVTIYGTTPAE